MTLWHVRRSTASAELLVALAAEWGVPAATCLRGTGMADVGDLADIDAQIAAWQELRLIGNIVAELGQVPAAGVLAGKHYHVTMYGQVGLGVLSSPTLAHALEFGFRFRRLAYGFCSIQLDPGPRSSALVLDNRRVPARQRDFVTERDMAAMATLVRDLGVPGQVVSRVDFARPRPPDTNVYSSLLGTDVTFDADRTCLVLDTRLLTQPLPLANSRTRHAAELDCVALLERRRLASGVTGQVRELLRAGEPMPSGIEQVAGELLTSTRTLRRRLAAEGTTFRDLLSSTRTAIAEDALTKGVDSVASIATRLGYSETAAFIHAFTRLHGVAPLAYRRAHVGGPAT